MQALHFPALAFQRHHQPGSTSTPCGSCTPSKRSSGPHRRGHRDGIVAEAARLATDPAVSRLLKMKDPAAPAVKRERKRIGGNMAGTRLAGQARGRAAEHVRLRTSVGALTIGLFLFLTQSSVNAQARQCPAGQMFCFGKCVDTSSDQANCGGCRVLCRDGQVCRDRICVTPSPLPPARATPPPQSR
jgi:Stigma-specific protein, Stig1